MKVYNKLTACYTASYGYSFLSYFLINNWPAPVQAVEQCQPNSDYKVMS